MEYYIHTYIYIHVYHDLLSGMHSLLTKNVIFIYVYRFKAFFC